MNLYLYRIAVIHPAQPRARKHYVQSVYATAESREAALRFVADDNTHDAEIRLFIESEEPLAPGIITQTQSALWTPEECARRAPTTVRAGDAASPDN